MLKAALPGPLHPQIDKYAADPTAPAPKKLKALARAGLPPAARPALWFRLSGGEALRSAAPASYEVLVASVDPAASECG